MSLAKLGTFQKDQDDRIKAMSIVPIGTTGVLFGAPVPDELGKADTMEGLEHMGFRTELLQEQLAQLASSPDTYGQYLEAKRNILDKIRGETVRFFIQQREKYRMLGHPIEEARKLAKRKATEYKASEMEIFYTLFPNAAAGNVRVVRTY